MHGDGLPDRSAVPLLLGDGPRKALWVSGLGVPSEAQAPPAQVYGGGRGRVLGVDSCWARDGVPAGQEFSQRGQQHRVHCLSWDSLHGSCDFRHARGHAHLLLGQGGVEVTTQGAPIPARACHQVPDGPQDMGAQGPGGEVLQERVVVRVGRIPHLLVVEERHLVAGACVGGPPSVPGRHTKHMHTHRAQVSAVCPTSQKTPFVKRADGEAERGGRIGGLGTPLHGRKTRW